MPREVWKTVKTEARETRVAKKKNQKKEENEIEESSIGIENLG